MERRNIESITRYIKNTEYHLGNEPYIETAGMEVTHPYMWIGQAPYDQPMSPEDWQYFEVFNKVYEDCLELDSWQKILSEAKVKREQLGLSTAMDVSWGVYFVLTENQPEYASLTFEKMFPSSDPEEIKYYTPGVE